MKILIALATASFFFAANNANSQCCPYVDPVELIPVSPFDTDSVYVVTNVTTPNAGSYLGYDIIDLGSTIRIEACYYSGMLTVLQTYTDTINLGLLNGGNYAIEFVAYQSSSDVNCVPTDSNTVSSTVTVISTLDNEVLEKVETFNVYPTAVNNGILMIQNVDVLEVPYRIINVVGQVVLQGQASAEGVIDVSALNRGLFYVTIFPETKATTFSIFVE